MGFVKMKSPSHGRKLGVLLKVFNIYLNLSSVVSSNAPLITGYNREIGNKWTYLKLQYGDSDESLLSAFGSTAAPTKVTSARPVPVSTTVKPQHFIRIPEYENACGVAKGKPLHSPYVIGGQLANTGEFPWFAAITKYQYNSNPKWKVVCGASLLNSNYAITAAHCLHGRYKETLEVVFNLKDTTNITYTASRGEIRRKIARFVVHPQYNPRTQHEDIALIQFKEPIDLRREKIVTPICLPESSRENFASANGVFVGFGHTSYGSNSSKQKENSRHLMKVYVPILSHSQCLKSKVPIKKNITENMVCAGAPGKDACINDSGGPLMAVEKGKIVLVGLASWGIGCALPDYPGVYTRVSQYLTWIKTASSL